MTLADDRAVFVRASCTEATFARLAYEANRARNAPQMPAWDITPFQANFTAGCSRYGMPATSDETAAWMADVTLPTVPPGPEFDPANFYRSAPIVR